MLCCAKNRRCESSRVTSPLSVLSRVGDLVKNCKVIFYVHGKHQYVQNGLQYYLFNVVGSVMTDVSVSRKPIESSTSWAFPIKSGCYITHSPYLSQNVMPLKRLFVFCFVSDLLLAVVPKLRQKFVNWTGRGSQGRRGETKPSRSINVHA